MLQRDVSLPSPAAWSAEFRADNMAGMKRRGEMVV